MQTSAAGSRPCRRSTRVVRGGFTLLELIVVIAIIAMATAGVAFAMRDGDQASIDREADRLAALLEAARAQSRASGTAVRWRPVADGFVFEGLAPGSLPQGWLVPGMSAQAAMPDGRPLPALLLGPDPIIASQRVLLRFAGPPQRTVNLASDGLRPFAVQPASETP
ncbi:MAG: type II secretion system protein GspH [Comamonadaceae bacterium]|nr:MAG: type II secretion system protein GspH [Comamonadaceae bacterium]